MHTCLFTILQQLVCCPSFKICKVGKKNSCICVRMLHTITYSQSLNLNKLEDLGVNFLKMRSSLRLALLFFMELTIFFIGNLDGSRSLRLLYFAMSIKFSLTWRAHLLISANHRMERVSKNDPWVIFNKITSSSMTLSEGNRHSFRICLANERYFHIKSFSGERFSAVYISPTGLI